MDKTWIENTQLVVLLKAAGLEKLKFGFCEVKLRWKDYYSKLIQLCNLTALYAPMAVLVRSWDDLRKWLFRRFPHMWIETALGWAEAKKPDYHKLLLFFYVLQIYPTRGALPHLTEPPTNAEKIEIHRRGLENAPPGQTVPDPAKQIGNMMKNTDLDAFVDFDNQYAVGPTDPIILTGVNGQLYGGHQNIKWLLDYLDNQFYMVLTYFYLTLDEGVVINRIEKEPVYMDLEESKPSPECQQRRRNFIAGMLEQSWPTRVLSTGRTFNRKLDMQNCLFRLPPRIHPMDPLNLFLHADGGSIASIHHSALVAGSGV